MSQQTVEVAEVFKPLYQRKRYKGAKGGRGSGKSHDRAQALVLEMVSREIRAVCIREIQKSIQESAKQLIEDKINALGLARLFDIQSQKIICTATGSECLFQGMQDHTADTIKSLEGIDIAWVEEANKLSHRSMRLLRPTIRKQDSEIWFTWNPEDEEDPVDQLLCGPEGVPDNAVVVHANYEQNPWLPDTLKDEIKLDRERNPEMFAHIWLGDYADITEGSYYASLLLDAKDGNRITRVPYDPIAKVFTAWDLGIGDDTSIWFFQKVGHEIRIIDFYENNGEALNHYVNVLGRKPYTYGEAILPHDAAAKELGTGKSREEVLRSLGVNAIILPAQSIDDGINAVRTILPRCWFDEENCKDGLRHLKRYKRLFDDKRNTFKPKPDHDEHSHAADAFRYLAMGLDQVRDGIGTFKIEMPALGVA